MSDRHWARNLSWPEPPNDFWEKGKIKNALSEDYKTIYEQDHFESKYLLRDNIADMKKAKATYSMNQSISNKKLRASFILLGIQHPFSQATESLAPEPLIL